MNRKQELENQIIGINKVLEEIQDEENRLIELFNQNKVNVSCFAELIESNNESFSQNFRLKTYYGDLLKSYNEGYEDALKKEGHRTFTHGHKQYKNNKPKNK